MYENIYKLETVYKNKKESMFLKMLILTSQRPIRFKALGFFTLDNKSFKDVSVVASNNVENE